MNRGRVTVVLVVILAALAGGAFAAGAWRDKVDPWVLDTAERGSTEFLVFLAEQADLSGAEALTTKRAKNEAVFQALTATAARTQGPLLAQLELAAVEHRAYWIANMVWVRGDLAAVEALARRADVAHIYANPAVRLDEPVAMPELDPRAGGDATRAVEWNISHVNAPAVWALGDTGAGAVVAGADTGYLWTHPALVNQYRGSAGDHNYAWWDAIHSGGGSCGADSPAPCDDYGHGTHTMGTMVGDDGGTNQVGMAPDATWIGCRNMNQRFGTPTTYAECYQFFLAPTDLSGANPDPSMAPDVVNNSWGCPPSEGCTDPNVLLTVVQNVHAAGIVTVQSAGNGGPSCESVANPAAIYDESFSVGATTSSDGIWVLSARGPVTIDGSGRRKPDVVAPGVGVRSSTFDGGYGVMQGTSMAAPHVAGLVALLVAAHPGLPGNVDLIEEAIERTAVGRTTSEGCGGDPLDAVPNNTYGWGRIDALAAYNYSFDYDVTVSPGVAAVCAPDDAVVDVAVAQFLDFDEPVGLTAEGVPAGASASFDPATVTPPGSSALTIAGTGAVAPGRSTIEVIGMSSPSGIEHRTAFELAVFDAAPAAVTPVTPADGAGEVALPVTFGWQAADQAASYRLEVATDAAFSTVVANVETPDLALVLETALAPATDYWWRVTATNPCAPGIPGPVFSFTTRAIPPVLLVDDDDNFPDERAIYTLALDAAGQAYDVWDTGNGDDEPGALELTPYRVVVWFTGDEFGGAAGPGTAGETALAGWLDGGDRCLLLSSQDYFRDRGLTSFMESHLGVASVVDDAGHATVTGAGAVFDGLGSFVLSYPFQNYSDALTPGPGAGAAFMGDQGVAAAELELGTSYTTYWAFPFESLPTATDRQTVLAAFLDHCLTTTDLFADGFESGDTSMWSSAAP